MRIFVPSINEEYNSVTDFANEFGLNYSYVMYAIDNYDFEVNGLEIIPDYGSSDTNSLPYKDLCLYARQKYLVNDAV